MLLTMAGLCLLPVLAAWGVFRLSPTFERHSYGQLLPTGAFAAATLPGWPLGSWSLVSIEPGACDAACAERRFLLRQIRLAQGEAATRMVAVRLIGRADEAVPQDGRALVAPALARQLARRGFFLVDPRGNQVLFYPDGSDPLRVIDEINRVMRVNNAL
ncbi:hypothetical protein [Paludibacterium purpuratum]|nr:hypothetical protein [Paludibacterium purpuratum]